MHRGHLLELKSLNDDAGVRLIVAILEFPLKEESHRADLACSSLAGIGGLPGIVVDPGLQGLLLGLPKELLLVLKNGPLLGQFFIRMGAMHPLLEIHVLPSSLLIMKKNPKTW